MCLRKEIFSGVGWAYGTGSAVGGVGVAAVEFYRLYCGVWTKAGGGYKVRFN